MRSRFNGLLQPPKIVHRLLSSRVWFQGEHREPGTDRVLKAALPRQRLRQREPGVGIVGCSIASREQIPRFRFFEIESTRGPRQANKNRWVVRVFAEQVRGLAEHGVLSTQYRVVIWRRRINCSTSP